MDIARRKTGLTRMGGSGSMGRAALGDTHSQFFEGGGFGGGLAMISHGAVVWFGLGTGVAWGAGLGNRDVGQAGQDDASICRLVDGWGGGLTGALWVGRYRWYW